jgi:hypothetical protein
MRRLELGWLVLPLGPHGRRVFNMPPMLCSGMGPVHVVCPQLVAVLDEEVGEENIDR